jgi:signal transduction histidine kinase
MVDNRQVTAALIEVISNAIQATDEKKGHVTLHAAYDAHGGNVVISINDNGCGMDEETLRRAFDPFFSSKPAGRRRGMGLAKSLRWIEASGGSIRLESRVDHGTRAILLLPVSGVDAAAPQLAQAAEA